MKAIFERKPSDFDLRSFEVSKTIRLPAEVFEAVLQKPMRNYDFIQENIEQMHCDSSGVSFHTRHSISFYLTALRCLPK